MRREILKAMLWKEWRETRLKWLAFALAFHIPLAIAGLFLAFEEAVRFDVLVMTDGYAPYVLAGALVFQSAFLITAGLFLLSFFAVGSVGAELDNHSIFFIFDRPVRRWQVLLFKFVVGAVQATTCVGLSILTTVTLVYVAVAGMATYVTLDGSWAGFVNVISNATRGTVWTMTIALMVYAATFLFSVLFEKWWIAVIAGGVSIVVMFYNLGDNLFEWVINRATRPPGGDEFDLEFYGRLDPVPIMMMLVVTAGFYFASQYVFERKEMR
jgi:ABC-type transport system involved in multi-copper enzyme maturation permease subunit